MATLRVGFAGLGNIGTPMAARIHQAGHALRVHNRTRATAEAFAAPLGVPVHGSPAELAADSDVVCLCLADAAAVEHVLFGAGGVVHGGRKGLLVIDLSTIHPVQSRDMAARLSSQYGIDLVDAPVSGGAVGAAAGTLAVMAGGTPEAVERAKPVLASFAGRITHIGPSGQGMAGKALNQMLSFGTATVIAETLNLAAALGIDPAVIPEMVQGGFADSNVLKSYGRAMIEGTYKGKTSTGVKDIDIAADLARLAGAPAPITSLVASFFRLALSQGNVDSGLGTPMRLYVKGRLSANENGPLSATRRPG
jgi:3-hydroxyisobutyrate dehydrogenase